MGCFVDQLMRIPNSTMPSRILHNTASIHHYTIAASSGAHLWKMSCPEENHIVPYPRDLEVIRVQNKKTGDLAYQSEEYTMNRVPFSSTHVTGTLTIEVVF